MKYSKTTLMELSHKYSSILRKCALLNAAILMGAMVALPAGAETITTRQEISTDKTFLEDVTADLISGGYQGGAIENSAETTFNGTSSFTNNSAERAGGAINNTGTLIFDKSATFTSNKTTNGAGGAVSNSGTITFKDTVNFSSNTALAETPSAAYGIGGAIHNQGTMVFEKLATFNGNHALEYGNAINNNSTGVMNFKGGLTSTNNISADGYIATNGITNDGTMTVIGGDITITGNTAHSGAGISSAADSSKLYLGAYLNDLDEVVEAPVDKITFSNNTAVKTTAGALYAAGEGKLYANTITFDSNSNQNDGLSAAYAGAIAQQGGTLDIIGNTNKFTNNHANATTTTVADQYKFGGGAIQASNGSTLVIGKSGSTNIFSGNTSAMNGGAIHTRKSTTDVTLYGDTSFSDNTADLLGGAIYNHDSKITFNGNTTFSNNKANGVANDIYSNGTINFNGDVTLDGGIAGAGIVNFAENTSLTAELQKTTILANTVAFGGNNIINLKVANGLADDEYDFIDADTLTKNGVTIADNAVYNLTLTDEGKVNVSVKSGSEIAESIDVPVTAQEANTLGAVIASNGNGTGIGNAIADAMSDALQSGNAAAAVQAAKELAPTTSQQVMGIAQGVNNLLSNVTGTRMAALGKSGGDAFIGGSTWVQGLYNHTKQDASGANAGFSANTKGIAFGIDGKANDALTIGIGYGYTVTDADSAGRNVDVDGHNIFVYGQYQPEQFYVNTMLSYGLSKYTEKKSPMGVAMKAKYDVNTFAANLMTGYDFNTGITPEGGLRYISADQESYNDGAQNISTDRNDVLTAVMGVKYTANVKAEDWTFKPTLRLAATYDVKSDNSKANVNIIGGGNYQITGDRLHRFGVETGVGVTSSVKDWDLTLEYNGGYRKDFQSHTGMLKATYHF